MELEFLVGVLMLMEHSIEPEVRWWYICIVEEVEWKGSTTVRYLIQQIFIRPYILECTTQAMVSYRITVEFEFEFQAQAFCNCKFLVLVVMCCILVLY